MEEMNRLAYHLGQMPKVPKSALENIAALIAIEGVEDAGVEEGGTFFVQSSARRS